MEGWVDSLNAAIAGGRFAAIGLANQSNLGPVRAKCAAAIRRTIVDDDYFSRS